jgi:peroxiredoxin
MFKRIIVVTAVTLLLMGLVVVPTQALQIGQQAPDFQLNDLSGSVHKLSDYHGKIVVIDFFGADCIPCKTSATNDLVPLFNNYYRNDARVQFLSVEVTGASAAHTNSNFVQPTGITWPVLVGGTSLVSSYGISTTPTVYVVDPTGKVALAMPYPVNVQTLKSTIDASLPGVASAPAVCAQNANSLDLFAKGTDQALWWKHYQSGSWGTWESLGGILTADPAATSSAAGHLDVFVRGTDGALWQREYSNGVWGSWSSLGGIMYPGTGPAASSWGSGRLDVFVEGTDSALWHRSHSGTWSGWESLGGRLTSSPGATSPGSSMIDVFVRGTDGALWWKNYNGEWQGWTSIGGM